MALNIFRFQQIKAKNALHGFDVRGKRLAIMYMNIV